MKDANTKRLKKLAEHIRYELDMFKYTAKYLRTTKDQFLINVLLESFAIHSRNLFKFIYPDKQPHKDDIVVGIFVDKKRFYLKNRTPRKELKFIVKKANKQVAHLTYFRLRYNRRTKPWDVLRIENGFRKTIEAFLKSIPEQEASWFNSP